MRWNMSTCVAAAVAVCLCGASMAQTPVGNSSFESTLAYNVAPAPGNWTGFFGGPATSVLAAEQSTVAPRTGLNALHLKVFGPDGNAFCGMQQPVNGIVSGVTYSMSIWARTAGNINNPVEYRIEWKEDATGAFVGDEFALTTDISSQITASYQQFTLTAAAPATAVTANLVVDLQDFTFNPVNPMFDTEVFIDDVSFGAASLSTQTACCFVDGTCQVNLAGGCPSGSSPMAAGSTCSPNTCPTLTPGACCNPSTGACVVTIQTTCTTLSGQYHGDGAFCTPGLCPTGGGSCHADFNGNGHLEVQDIFDFLSAWFAGCP